MIAVVLNGGRSTRFGEDKSEFPINNSTMVEIVVSKVQMVFNRVVLVGKPHPKIPYILDKYFVGPIGGLLTALETFEEDVFLVGCDMPCIMPEVVKRMVKLFDDKIDALVPKLSDGFHPLHAVYSRRMIRHIRHALLAGNNSFREVFLLVNVKYLTDADFSDIPNWEKSFININTKADLRLLEVV